MIQFPPYPPGFDPGQYPPTLFDRIAAFIVLYMALLTLIGHCLSLNELEDKLNRRRKDDQHDH